MRKGGSKQKGGSFERGIAVALSKWLSYEKREDLLWRSSMSGGRATIARKRGKELQTQAGDLSAIHPSGQPFLNKFYLELKNYRDLQFTSILTNTGHLVKFWQSTSSEACNYKRSPMLIVKQNRMPTVIFMQGLGIKMLGLSTSQCIIVAPRLGMYGILFEDFIKLAKPIV